MIRIGRQLRAVEVDVVVLDGRLPVGKQCGPVPEKLVDHARIGENL